MEENNGRTNVENPTIDELKDAYAKLDEYAKQLYMENKQLKNQWILNRMSMNFKIVELKEFSSEAKIRAIEDIENFMYPKQETIKKSESNEQVCSNK